jgi:hypothetical protein
MNRLNEGAEILVSLRHPFSRVSVTAFSDFSFLTSEKEF